MPTGIVQGSYYFLSLHTRKKLVRNNWMALPIPAEVLSTVHTRVKNTKQFYSQTKMVI